jgi:hypothetical protein
MKKTMFLIVCICLGASCKKDAHQTDPQAMEGNDTVKYEMRELDEGPIADRTGRVVDKEILNINRLTKAIWHPHGAMMKIFLYDGDEFDFINIPFHNHYESYGSGGRFSHFTEEFMAQINKKYSEGVPLINYVQKGGVVTLLYADSSKVMFLHDHEERMVKERKKVYILDGLPTLLITDSFYYRD